MVLDVLFSVVFLAVMFYYSGWLTLIVLASLKQDFAKAEYQDGLTTLEAPVDGTVQQLNVHTVGGVVRRAQPLLTIHTEAVLK